MMDNRRKLSRLFWILLIVFSLIPAMVANAEITTYTYDDVNRSLRVDVKGGNSSITSSAGAGGTITPLGRVVVAFGGSKTYTITPDGHYHVKDVKVDGQSVGAVTSYTFSNITANHTIDAEFAMDTYQLRASKNSVGTGSGTITSAPAGINCGNACSATFNYNTSVALTAIADAGTDFAGWSGACTGGGNCNVSLTDTVNVAANFSCITPRCAPSGAFNAVTNQCEASAITTCPSGYTLSGAICISSAAQTCPAGGSYNVSTNRCEAASGNSNYQCPTTSQVYSSQSSCSSACTQSAYCTAGTVTVSGGPVQWDPSYTIQGSGNQLNIIKPAGCDESSCWDATVIGTITVPGAFLSGSAFGLSYGSSLEITPDSICQIGKGGFGCITVSGIVSLTPTTFDTSHSGYMQGDANKLCWNIGGPGCSQFTTINASAMTQCPLTNGSSCSGSPGSCTAPNDCVPAAACPAGYNFYNGICTAFVTSTCAGGGSYNNTSNRCETTPSGLQYQCLLNNQIYDTQSACGASCTQTATCTAGTVTVSGGPIQWNQNYNLQGSGTQLNIIKPAGCDESSCWDETVIGTITVPGASFSGSVFGGSSGSSMDITANSICQVGKSGYGCITVSGSVTLTPTTLDTSHFGYMQGDGNKLCWNSGGPGCSQFSTINSSAMTQCPLTNGSACSGSPAFCSGPLGCQSGVRCPSGYIFNGTTCSAASTCQAGTQCTYSISPASSAFNSNGSAGSVAVDTFGSCAWAVSSNPAWVTITSGSNGNGNGTVNYTVLPNATGAARTGQITLNGLIHTVTQNGSDLSNIGVFRPSTGMWYLDLNGNGVWDGCGTDGCYTWGIAGDYPVVGDWNGSGTRKIGVFRPSTGMWYLDLNGNGTWDGCGIEGCLGPWGTTGDFPVVGDWNGSGTAKIGVFRPSTGMWYLDLNGNHVWDEAAVGPWGSDGDIAVVGDWNGSGTKKIGIFRPSTGMWYLDFNGNGVWDANGPDLSFPYGGAGDIPIIGDWNGSGTSKIGVFRPSTGMWYLDFNGNGVWDGNGTDLSFPYGGAGDIPVAGKW